MPTNEAIMNLLWRWGCKPISGAGVCHDLREMFAPSPGAETACEHARPSDTGFSERELMRLEIASRMLAAVATQETTECSGLSGDETHDAKQALLYADALIAAAKEPQ